jgi:hypothetical protein
MKMQRYMNVTKPGMGNVMGIMIVVILFSHAPARAIWLGQSQLNPYLEVQASYDSNIFGENDENDPESDIITTISPGLHVEFPTTQDARFRLTADYRSNLNFYSKAGDSAVDPGDELNHMDHRLAGQMELDLVSGLNFSSGYTLNLSSVAPDNENDEREAYTDHQVMARVGYRFVDRYEAQVGYTGAWRRYDELSQDDATTHGVEGAVFYRLFPALWVLGGTSYSLVDRDEAGLSDSTELRGFGGARLEATEQWSGQIKAGAVAKDFDEADMDDATAAYVAGELVGNLADSTTIIVRLSRDVAETSVAEDSAGSGAYYVLTSGEARVTHSLAAWPNLSLSGRLGLGAENYPDDPEEREDSLFTVELGARYTLWKYLSFGVQYRHQATDSNLDRYDQSGDVATVSVQALL